MGVVAPGEKNLTLNYIFFVWNFLSFPFTSTTFLQNGFTNNDILMVRYHKITDTNLSLIVQVHTV